MLYLNKMFLEQRIKNDKFLFPDEVEKESYSIVELVKQMTKAFGKPLAEFSVCIYDGEGDEETVSSCAYSANAGAIPRYSLYDRLVCIALTMRSAHR